MFLIQSNLPLLDTDTISWNRSGWIKGNVGQKGFYRVNYDDANWDALANALKNDLKVGISYYIKCYSEHKTYCRAINIGWSPGPIFMVKFNVTC